MLARRGSRECARSHRAWRSVGDDLRRDRHRRHERRARGTTFRAAHPAATLALDATVLGAHAVAVRAGRLDVGFAVGFAPLVGPGEPALASTRVLCDPLAGALLPATHALARRARTHAALTPADLTSLPLVSFPRAWRPREAEDELARLRADGWRGRLGPAGTSAGALNAMVRCGAGWVHAPVSLAAAVPYGLAYCPLEGGGGTPADVYALTRHGAGDPGGEPLVAAFLSALRGVRGATATPG